MKTECYKIGPYETNTVLIKNEEAQEAIVIDAPPTSHNQLKDKLANYQVHLFLTHGHWDHMAEAKLFQEDGAKIYAHKEDKQFLQNPEIMNIFTPFGIKVHAVTPDVLIKHDDIFQISNLTLKILHLPGHCPGGVGIYSEKLQSAFVGDTLFSGGIGRHDLPGGDCNALKKSIKNKLFALPPNTKIYPGHGPVTNVKDEKLKNPYV